jgi:hypothetical protein
MRAAKKRAAEQELESWVVAHRNAMLARDIEDLIQMLVRDRDEDEAFLTVELRNVTGGGEAQIDEANRVIQDMCDRSLRIVELAQECVRDLRKLGHEAEGADQLEGLVDAYRRWKDDYPDLLIMAYGPVREVVRERVAKALASSDTESNWQALFEDEDKPA